MKTREELFQPNENKALELFAQKIRKIFGKRLMGLRIFGSRSRDKGWEESDIDLMVLIDGLTWEEKRCVWDEATNINIQYDLLLSPFVLRPEEFKKLHDRERRIALDIEREGIDL